MMKGKMRLDEGGQISTEYLVIMAFLLIVIGILFAYSLLILNETTKLSMASDAAATLAKTADQVSALGPGTKIHVNANFPTGIAEASISGKLITIKVNVVGGITEVWEYSKADITPTSLPTEAGNYLFRVEMVDGNITITQI